MAKVNQAQEPSMEEILASIRRIISDDGDDALSPVKPPPSISTEAIDALFGARVAAAEAIDPIPAFLRAEAKPAPARAEARQAAAEPPATSRPRSEAPRPAASIPRPAAASPQIAEAPVRAEPKRPATVVATPPASSAAAPAPLPADAAASTRSLLSPAAGAAVTASFGSLATTLTGGQPKTVEDLVKDMLRPMLQSWLDSNLPVLVERLVREEIERVARGR